MPLRDHFRAPLDNIASWEELHGGWPMVIVQQLHKILPSGYVAGPAVHSGTFVEVDVGDYEKDEPKTHFGIGNGNGGTATAVWASTKPTLAVETTLPDCDEYEVRIYDDKRRRHLVAAIEIVSPANKDRPEHRNIFIAKCTALLQKGVAVSIVDLVTVRHFNLYTDLLTFIGHDDPTMGSPPPDIYAASCRWIRKQERTFLETWSNALKVGQPLPALPLWLSPELVVPLDLEKSYEQACRDLRIP
jgi:hypothetical protein